MRRIKLFVAGVSFSVVPFFLGGILVGNHATQGPGACLVPWVQAQYHDPQPECP